MVSRLLQVQATDTSSKYYRGGACPFQANVGGSFTAPELSLIAGVPGTDPSFLSYLWQQLCKGRCHKPVKPLTAEDNILDMLTLNTNFKCENEDVRLNGDDVLSSWNEQVQKPVCEVVGDTVVCILNMVHKTIYVNMFLLKCAVNHKVFVVSPEETFGNFQCNLTPNLYAILVHDVYEVNLLSNPQTNAKKSERPKLIFAPEGLGKEVLTYLKLWHDAMPATKTLQEYDHLLKKWGQVCGENSGHNTTAVCTSMTAEMANVCKKVLTDKDRAEIAGIRKCVNDFYKGLKKSTKEHEALDYWCGLKKWVMDKDMTKCVNSLSNPLTPKEDGGHLFAFIRSIGDGIYAMGKAVISVVQISFNALCYVSECVDWVLLLSYKPLLIAWGWKEIGMFSSFWALMFAVYKFSGKVENPTPGSKSIWEYMKFYFFGLFLIPWTFCRKVKHNHEEIIGENLSKTTEAQFERLLAQQKIPTTEAMFSFVKQTIAQNHEEIIDENLSKITEAQFERLLAQQKIPTTEAMFSFIKQTIAQESEVTRQTFQNVRKDLRFIQNALEEHDSMLEEEDSDRTLEQKLASEVVPTIQESVQAGDGERWRRLLADD